MEPGFHGLQQVQKGQLLARDRHGEVRALANGRLLMPLYQPVGSDGFFLVSKVSLFWLALSSLLRRMRVDRTLHWLPGIRPDEAEPGALRVDRRVARWLVVEIFHLLGFRRRRQDGEQFVFSRRPG
jgi:hypothetical protein